MTAKEQKQLKEKLIAGNPKAKKVGGIAVPRTVKGQRTKITRVETSVQESKSLSTKKVRPRSRHIPELQELLDEQSYFIREPSMPGFTSFSNKRKMKKAI